MTAVALALSITQRDQVLYYETGFEQLHPIPPIHDWMTQLGHEYYRDWRCKRQLSNDHDQYVIEFPNSHVMNMFMLKWL
jgi:hypothetical protein